MRKVKQTQKLDAFINGYIDAIYKQYKNRIKRKFTKALKRYEKEQKEACRKKHK